MHPFSPKALRFIRRPPEEDAFLNILEGSVRSGKTWAMIPKILALCRYKVAGKRVMIGVSKQKVHDNVLSDLFDFVGEGRYSFNRQSGELVLFGVKWLVIGVKDEGSEKYIRGLTVGVAYVDEATLLPESSFKMLLTRMSPTGARLYATTNPDTPFHYLKKDFLDNPEMQKYLWSDHFTMADNLSLDATTRERYERQFTGVFRQRFILGLWVIAEGAIYRDSWSDDNEFDDSTMPIALLNPGGFVDRFVAIDYGTTNQCVFLDIVDDGRTLWVVREYVWDSAKEYRQKTDRDYADDLVTFMQPSAQQPTCVRGTQQQGQAAFGEVIVDPSAASFKAELLQKGIWHTDANNEVLDGIRMTSSLMAQKKLKIHRACTNLIGQLQSYAWNPKAAQRGEEEPLKVNDHGPDAARYGVATKIPAWRLAA